MIFQESSYFSFFLLPLLSLGPIDEVKYAAEERLDTLLKSLAKDTSGPKYVDSSVNDLAYARAIEKESRAEALPVGTGSVGKGLRMID